VGVWFASCRRSRSAQEWSGARRGPNSTKGGTITSAVRSTNPQRPSLWPLLASSLSSSLLVLQTRHQSISHINCLTSSQAADDPQILRPIRAYITTLLPHGSRRLRRLAICPVFR
jgi:hypothetical protein